MLNVLSDGILLEDSETQKLLQECKTIFLGDPSKPYNSYNLLWRMPKS